MSAWVVDASVVAKWFLHEEHADPALRVLRGGEDMHAPDYMVLEMDSVLCKHVRRGSLDPADAGDIRTTMAALPVTYHPFALLRDAAYELAVRTQRSLYDCLYLALAVALDARMVTADRKLCDALAHGPLSENVVWVQDVP